MKSGRMRMVTIIGLTILVVGSGSHIASGVASQTRQIKAPSLSSSDPWAELKSELWSKGLDPSEISLPADVTPEMVEWAREQVSADTPRETADELLRALVDSDGFGLQYSPNFTGTAVDVFATRRANCLAFTHLFVGLTRALGVRTFYVNWNLVEGYHREEDIVVISGHVSAGQGRLNDLYVLQFGAVEGLEVRGVVPISDINALARHYANRTSELLRDRDLEAALEAGELATRIDPALDDAWVNLGVARRRAGDLDGAAAAYNEATRIDPDNLAAYRNLRVLLRIRGEQDAAEQILKLLERRGSRNPYLYLELGDESIAAGFVDEAGPYYRRANNLGPKLAETRAARGLWFLEIGNREKARKWLRKAQAIDRNEARTRKLESRFGRGAAP